MRPPPHAFLSTSLKTQHLPWAALGTHKSPGHLPCPWGPSPSTDDYLHADHPSGSLGVAAVLSEGLKVLQMSRLNVGEGASACPALEVSTAPILQMRNVKVQARWIPVHSVLTAVVGVSRTAIPFWILFML